MTDKELVERLRLNANCMMDEWEPTLCKRSEFITAADRIEQLHAELTNERIDNTNLIGELATVTAERDRYKAVHENPQPLTLEEVKEHITKGHPNDIICDLERIRTLYRKSHIFPFSSSYRPPITRHAHITIGQDRSNTIPTAFTKAMIISSMPGPP